MKWHRGQQLWLGLLSIIPGVLTYLKLVRPVYTALMLIVLYFLSKRHGFLVQRQFEKEAADKREEEAAEKRRMAALPMRKRRSIEKAKLRNEAREQAGQAGNVEEVESEKDE